MNSITGSRKLYGRVLAAVISSVAVVGVINAGTVIMGNSTSSTPTITTPKTVKAIEVGINPSAQCSYTGSNIAFQSCIASALSAEGYSASVVQEQGMYPPMRVDVTPTAGGEIPDVCVYEEDFDIQYVKVAIPGFGGVAKIRMYCEAQVPVGNVGFGGTLYITINDTVKVVSMARITSAAELNTAIGTALTGFCSYVTDEPVEIGENQHIHYWRTPLCNGVPPTSVSLRSTNPTVLASEVALVQADDLGTQCTFASNDCGEDEE